MPSARAGKGDQPLPAFNGNTSPLAMVAAWIGEGTSAAEHAAAGRGSVLQITQIRRALYPFLLFAFPAAGHDIRQAFPEEY